MSKETLGNFYATDYKSETVIRRYDNWDSEYYEDKILDRVIYNTGDVVWFKFQDGSYVVCGYLTHDNLFWKEPMEAMVNWWEHVNSGKVHDR